MKVRINEGQLKMLIENDYDEGMNIIKQKFNNYSVMSHNDKHDQMVDDKVFNEDGELNVKKIKLPKSNIISYNLYDIKSNKLNKALKHGVTPDDTKVVYDINSMRTFFKKTVEYIFKILNGKDVDIITCPQSSGDLNLRIINMLIKKYPQSEGIKAIPDLITKNVRNIKVNSNIAKQLGMNDGQIEALKRRVNKWKIDENIRDLRAEIIQIRKEIEDFVLSRKGKKGRYPAAEYDDKYEKIHNKSQQIRQLRKGLKGKDSTFQDHATVKQWQIKGLDNNDRLSIENIFEINPILIKFINKLKDKTVVVIDDNISSGATIDDICIMLLKVGVKNVIPITIGTMSQTHFERGH